MYSSLYNSFNIEVINRNKLLTQTKMIMYKPYLTRFGVSDQYDVILSTRQVLYVFKSFPGILQKWWKAW